MAMALAVSLPSVAAVTVKEVGGWFESGYVTFEKLSTASTYAVYYKSTTGDYLKLDSELVRDYGTYGRADVLGITAGTYQFKIVPIDAAGNELTADITETTTFEAKAHDRTGFAHHNYSGIGAYQDNGQLKPDAQVIYVTGKTAKTVKATLDGTTFTGLQAIFAGANGKYGNRPLCVRIVGTIKEADMDRFDSSAEGLQIKGRNSYEVLNITLEGVGNDATIHGFGFLLRNATSVELRNFAIMNCRDDAVSLDTDNSHCWIHHLDLFYGAAGGASDQAKGDGTIDMKEDSQYLTISYNHFWDSGKSSLCGMKSESGPNYITYHHNWFDHSDSRHPRVRTMTVHVYNNYFDGVAKYGVGSTTGSSVFVESNYFRNTHYPMLISLQGSDVASDPKGTFSGEDGGIIKSFNNVFAEKGSSFRYVTYQQNATEFDAYEATTRDEQVPATVVAKKGGGTYNNFDTSSTLMYACTPDAPADVPAIVTGQYGAGRVQHGDFQWTFNNATDDSDYSVNASLKSAVVGYQSSLVGIFGSTGGGDPVDPVDPENPDPDPENPNPSEPDPSSGYACWFTSTGASNSFYSVTGNVSNSKGTVNWAGQDRTYCLKLESATSVSFTLAAPMRLTLVFGPTETPSIKVDGTKKTDKGVSTYPDANVAVYELAAGAHQLTKADTRNLFYIDLEGESSAIQRVDASAIDSNAPIYDLTGRIVRQPARGIYIQAGRKIVIE